MKPAIYHKKIHGREVPMFVVDVFKKVVKKTGRGGHVLIPAKYIGQEAEVNVLIPRPFVCEGCADIISREENFSPDPKLCNSCYESTNAVKK